jgi:carbonic anhydrase/acetyltransferase-like protein (isoleucine patch superfamily)
MSKPIALIGYRAGLDLLVDIADEMGVEIAGIFDKYFYGNTESVDDIPFIGNEEAITDEHIKKYDFVLSSNYVGHSNIKNFEHNGDNLRKRRIKLFRERKLPMANLIHPSSYVSPKSYIGSSVIIARNCYVRAKSHISDFCFLDSGSAVAHDVRLGENVILTPYSFVAGFINIGDNTMIGAGSIIVNGYADKTLTIGNDVKVMAGCTVLKDVPDGKFVSNTGKILRRIDLKKE